LALTDLAVNVHDDMAKYLTSGGYQNKRWPVAHSLPLLLQLCSITNLPFYD